MDAPEPHRLEPMKECRLCPETFERPAQDLRFVARTSTRQELSIADALHDDPRPGRGEPDVLQVKADGARPERGKAGIEAHRRASWRASELTSRSNSAGLMLHRTIELPTNRTSTRP